MQDRLRSLGVDADIEREVQLALEHAIQLGEIGVQVAAYLNGELLVDSWIGDSRRGEMPVSGETLFPVFSLTKVLPVLAIHIQAERALIDYDEPLATYWPEYTAHGKGDITVRHVLAHRAGVPNVPEGLTIDNIGDWDWVVRALADLRPLFEPNTRSAYLSYSFGWLLGEVVRRTDPKARSFPDYVRDEILQPLEIDDIYLGLPDSEAYRVATLYTPGWTAFSDSSAPYWKLAVPPALAPGEIFNEPKLRAAVFPSAGSLGNARAFARLFVLLANGGALDGVRLLSEERLRRFTRLRKDPFEVDEVIGKIAIVGELGFRVGSDHPNAEPVIGHEQSVIAMPGAGGTVAWADLHRGLAVAICHNRMFQAGELRTEEQHPFGRLGRALRRLVLSRGD